MKPDFYPAARWTDAMLDALSYTVAAVSIVAGGISYAWRGWAGVIVTALLVGVLAYRSYRRAFPRGEA